MIGAVIADVDGVMVGKQAGVNFPLPHQDIITLLQKVAHRGIPIILCTAKFRVAIDGIIQQAELKNPHITDGGALIIDPLGPTEIIEQTMIDKVLVLKYLRLNDGYYTELYGAHEYFVQQNADKKLMAKRAELLQMEPTLVKSLEETANSTPIIKISSYTKDETRFNRLENQAKQLNNQVNYIWSHHPYIMPYRPLVITAAGVSKQTSAKKVADYLNIPLENMLGIGDSAADWEFMQLCGTVATVGQNQELKQLVDASGKPNFRGSSVDDHAVLEIFNHFGLID